MGLKKGQTAPFLGCLDNCCMCDLDDLLAYRMPQQLYLQHRNLGCIQLSMTFAVIVYIVVIEFWYNGGYASKESPVGTSRISTMRPDWTALPGKPSEVFRYCCDPSNTTVSANGCGVDGPGMRQTLPCVAWDEQEMTVPNSEEHSAFVATRVSVTSYSQVDESCDLNVNNRCHNDLTARTSTRTNYYTTDPESIQLMMQSTIYVPAVQDIRQSSGNSRHDDIVSAKMKKENGDDFMNFCQEDLGDSENLHIKAGQRRGSTDPDDQDIECRGGGSEAAAMSGRNWLRQMRSGDVLSIGQLLETLRIEENSDCANGLDCTNYLGGQDSYRYDGIQILLPMIFTQAGSHQLNYYYEPKWIRGREWEQNLAAREWSQGTETFFKYHGVRVQIVHVGEVGQFSLIEALKTFVGGMALMAVAGYIIERIVMKLPCWGGVQHLFDRYMHIYSHDFSSVLWEPNAEDPDGEPQAFVPTAHEEPRKMDDEMFTRGDTHGRYQGTGGDVQMTCCGLCRAPPPPGREKPESQLTWEGAHHKYGFQKDRSHEPTSI